MYSGLLAWGSSLSCLSLQVLRLQMHTAVLGSGRKDLLSLTVSVVSWWFAEPVAVSMKQSWTYPGTCKKKKCNLFYGRQEAGSEIGGRAGKKIYLLKACLPWLNSSDRVYFVPPPNNALLLCIHLGIKTELRWNPQDPFTYPEPHFWACDSRNLVSTHMR